MLWSCHHCPVNLRSSRLPRVLKLSNYWLFSWHYPLTSSRGCSSYSYIYLLAVTFPDQLYFYLLLLFSFGCILLLLVFFLSLEVNYTLIYPLSELYKSSPLQFTRKQEAVCSRQLRYGERSFWPISTSWHFKKINDRSLSCLLTSTRTRSQCLHHQLPTDGWWTYACKMLTVSPSRDVQPVWQESQQSSWHVHRLMLC